MSLSASPNLLLSRLPEAVSREIHDVSERKRVAVGDIIFEAQSPAEHVYFPEDHAVVSVVRELSDGSRIEVGVIGDEGVSALHSFLGARRNPDRGVCQNPGYLLRTPTARLREVGERNGSLMDGLLRFLNTLLVQVSQSAACNRLHTVERRLARWLLMMQDRARADELIVTQEFMAQMLGSRIAGVNEAVQALTRAGLISHRRNHVRICDRAGLQAASCECYQYVRDYMRETLP